MDDVVPWVAQTKNGTRPAARSAAMASASASARIAKTWSWATSRSRSVPIPAMRSPFSTLEWDCSVA